MSEQQLRQLVDRVATQATMPPTPFPEDERRGERALRRRRGVVVLAAAASVAAVGGGLVLGGTSDPRPDDRPAETPASVTPTSTPTSTSAPAPGTPAALAAAVTALLDPDGARIVATPGSSTPVERDGQVVMVSAELAWEDDNGGDPLAIGVRVAASAADAEWGCEDRCALTTYDVGGLTAWTTPRDDLGRTGTLVVREDGSAAALDVAPQLLTSGALTRADIDRVLTSPTLALPDGTATGPHPVDGDLVDRIAVDALPGLEVTTPSTDLHPAGSGLLDGAEVLWQADPARWSPGTCFWSRRCDVRVVDGTRLELSRTSDGGPFTGYVAVEHQGPVWRTRVLLPEGAVPLADLVALLTDPRWPH